MSEIEIFSAFLTVLKALFAAFGFKGGANPKLLVYSIIGLHITDVSLLVCCPSSGADTLPRLSQNPQRLVRFSCKQC